ncbi:hypothetical protein K438DRAFT_1778002 [Mycena galopus ATCC 62051]|nr:hypothetical protein K438DRAFT_1778002 [Mycena galopus ATCC 62051]
MQMCSQSSSGSSLRREVQGTGLSSCAIAALNFVEADFNSSVPTWTTTSTLFRDDALGNLIICHLTSLDQGVQNIYDEPLPLPKEPSIDFGPVGYDDFNVLAPNSNSLSSDPIRFIGFWTGCRAMISKLR